MIYKPKRANIEKLKTFLKKVKIKNKKQMATLFNTKISDTYVGLLKTIDNAVITASLKELTDGSGNQSGLYLNAPGS